MQPFPFWQNIPLVTPPTGLELAQLAAAAEQAQWTRYGVIVQAAAGVAALVAIGFTFDAARQARRQADAAWQQLEGAVRAVSRKLHRRARIP